MKMAVLAVVGLALAAPAHGSTSGVKLTMTPTGQHNGLEVRITLTISDNKYTRFDYPVSVSLPILEWHGIHSSFKVADVDFRISRSGEPQSKDVVLPRHGEEYFYRTRSYNERIPTTVIIPASVYAPITSQDDWGWVDPRGRPEVQNPGRPGSNANYYRTVPSAEYETPPPPAPEPETPTPPEPEPEPETPDHSHPVQRCDHIAVVSGMPLALSGDEDAPDHWLRIANPSAASITFAIEGWDEAGTKFGTYRRELPGYRSAKVKMRDIEAAFDATKPEGWWRLVVTGSGMLEAIAMMKYGESRIVLPVLRPEICESR